MRSTKSLAKLYLNDQEVGEVTVRGWVGPWGFGEFEPYPGFAPFAPLYNQWSHLMESRDGRGRLERSKAEALRELENATYAVRAKLRMESTGAWRDIALLNIDGTMIEWKERA